MDKRMATQAMKYVDPMLHAVTDKLKGNEKKQYEELQKQLAEFDSQKPQSLPEAMTIGDAGPVASPVTIPGKRNAEETVRCTQVFREKMNQAVGHAHGFARKFSFPLSG